MSANLSPVFPPALPRCLVCFVACFFLFAATASAGWKFAEIESHPGKNGLVTRVAMSAEEDESGETARVQLAVFDSRKATLRVLDQAEEPRISLAEMMRQSGALAGVNGGYFDPEHGAVGLLISEGKTVQAKQKAKLLSGVVSVVEGRVQIERAGSFAPRRRPSAARQCGPFLVERGRAVPGLNDTRAARRTFVLVGEKGQVAIGYASSVTLAQLAALLAAPGLSAAVKVEQALNLDGGSSSGFWFAGKNGAFSIGEQKTVRDFFGVVPRAE